MSAKKVIVGLVSVVMVFGLAACGSKSSEPTKTPVDTTSTAPESKRAYPLTLEEVAKHNTEKSCLVVVQGEVYDLTEWVYMHPGGPDKIMSICGTDATNAFMGQHGGMPRPQEMLGNYKVGALEG